MSIKKPATKTTKAKEKEVEVTLEETPIVTDEENTEEETTEVEVDETPVDVNNIPKEKNVRVKLREDVKFNFGSERYELHKGETYTVPVAVKLHLNGLGVLSPL